MTATAGVSPMASINARSSSFSSSLASNTASTNCAVLTRSKAMRTPICSTRSSVSRIPAVSARRSGISPSSTVSSTTSRVVPARSVTMERSQPASRFISVDLPAFGRPAMTVTTPSRRMRPPSKPASKSFSAVFPAARRVFSIVSSTCGMSSSG